MKAFLFGFGLFLAALALGAIFHTLRNVLGTFFAWLLDREWDDD